MKNITLADKRVLEELIEDKIIANVSYEVKYNDKINYEKMKALVDLREKLILAKLGDN